MRTRTSQTKIFIEKFIPINHSIIYHYQKAKKSFLRHRSNWWSWSSWESLLIVFIFRFHSDRVIFRFLFNTILFRILSNMVFFELSVIGFSSGSAVILLFSWVVRFFSFFPPRHYLFIKSCCYFLYQKQVFCFTIYSRYKACTQQLV